MIVMPDFVHIFMDKHKTKNSKEGVLGTQYISRKSALLIFTLISFSWVSADELVVTKENRPITIEATGTIISTETTHIGTPPSNSWSQTISFIVPEGKRVRKGEMIVRFSSNRQEERIKDYTDDLKVAKGELDSLIQLQAQQIEEGKLNLAQAEANLEKAVRKTELPADIIPSTEYQKLVEERRLAEVMVELWKERQEAAEIEREANLKHMEISIKRLESKLAGEQKEMQQLTVFSPRDAVAMIGTDYQESKLDVNSRVHPGLVVLYLIDEVKLAVQGNVPEHLATRLEQGQRARVVADSIGGAELTGYVDNIGSTVRKESRYSNAIVRDFWIQFDDLEDTELKVGMSVKITIQVGEEKDAIALPPEALVYQIDEPGAVVNGVWKSIRLGERSNGMYIIDDGLRDGDRIRL